MFATNDQKYGIFYTLAVIALLAAVIAYTFVPKSVIVVDQISSNESLVYSAILQADAVYAGDFGEFGITAAGLTFEMQLFSQEVTYLLTPTKLDSVMQLKPIDCLMANSGCQGLLFVLPVNSDHICLGALDLKTTSEIKFGKKVESFQRGLYFSYLNKVPSNGYCSVNMGFRSWFGKRFPKIATN